MFRLLAPILIVAVSGFGSNPGHYDQQHCVDAPAQEVAAYTASLGGGAEVLTSCDAVAADGAACADPEAKIGCCASCSEKQEARGAANLARAIAESSTSQEPSTYKGR